MHIALGEWRRRRPWSVSARQLPSCTWPGAAGRPGRVARLLGVGPRRPHCQVTLVLTSCPMAMAGRRRLRAGIITYVSRRDELHVIKNLATLGERRLSGRLPCRRLKHRVREEKTVLQPDAGWELAGSHRFVLLAAGCWEQAELLNLL